jgi:uncharacterized iron-regulated protein
MTEPVKKRTHALPIAITLFLVFLLFMVRDLGRQHIFKVQDGSLTSLEGILEDLSRVSLIFIGELHDRKAHHDAQLAVIRLLHEHNAEVAVGLEMFRAESQKELDRWIAGDLGLEEFKKIYHENWKMPWSLYGDILLYAREHGIPLLGLNVPDSITRQVARRGFDSLTPEQLRKLPGVSCDVDEAYEEFIREALTEGSHGKADFTNFCEAQMVWDTAMAARSLDFLERNPGYTVIVLAGSGHSWKRGVAAQVRRRSAVPLRTILPEISHQLNRENVTLEDTDYLWLGI